MKKVQLRRIFFYKRNVYMNKWNSRLKFYQKKITFHNVLSISGVYSLEKHIQIIFFQPFFLYIPRDRTQHVKHYSFFICSIYYINISVNGDHIHLNGKSLWQSFTMHLCIEINDILGIGKISVHYLRSVVLLYELKI